MLSLANISSPCGKQGQDGHGNTKISKVPL